MKLRRLPEIDLANIAPLELEAKVRRLKRHQKGGGFWSYDPARNQLVNILNPDPVLPLDLKAPDDASILKQVSAKCKNDTQRKSCVEVTKLTMRWAKENIGRSAEKHFPSLGIGSLGVVRYWTNVIFEYNGKLTVAYFDHRREHGFTSIGRRVTFSLMHQQIRVADPDLADAELMIVQFKQAPKAERGYQIYLASDIDGPLYSFDELQEMISETYEIWAELEAARAPASSKSGKRDEMTGDLFGDKKKTG